MWCLPKRHRSATVTVATTGQAMQKGLGWRKALRAAIAEPLVVGGVNAFDALHVASAVVGKADMFITTDDRLLKRARHLPDIKVLFPAEALAYLENWYEH